MAFHRYVVFDSRNNEEALTVFYRLSFVASLLATAAASAAHYLAGVYPALAIVLAPPATYVIYRVLAGLTTDDLWKTSVGRWLGVHTKNIEGSWQAEISKKSADGSASADKGTLSIEQTWRMISITLTTDMTDSNSTSVSMILEGNRLRIEYQYYATKKSPEGTRFEDHVGSATLTILMEAGKPSLGQPHLKYFTNHGEAGSMNLQQIKA